MGERWAWVVRVGGPASLQLLTLLLTHGPPSLVPEAPVRAHQPALP